MNNDKNVSPYALANLSYNYRPGSSFEIGVSVDRHPTDLVAPNAAGDVTKAQQSVVVYANLKHQFMPDFTGSLLAQYQHSQFVGGFYDGSKEQYYTLGLDLTYAFNPHLSANVGYNYDKVDSDIGGRTYDRNRVYFGVKASY